jgi:tetratricopeptide (TPR) repeat protein
VGSDQPSGADPPAELTGRTVGRYEIRDLIGSGGMGHVYRAWDPSLRRWVALKRLVPDIGDDRERRDRLLREARAASSLRHPAIVAIHDVFEHEGEGFLVQEFAEGARLRDRLQIPFALTAFLDFAVDCAGALVAAGESGIVHCDLKPENILVTAAGRPRIFDFGLACHHSTACPGEETTVSFEVDEAGGVAGALGQAGGTSGVPPPAASPVAADVSPRRVLLEGTAAYMAPERIRGAEPDARTDLFALGVIFYEMLTTRHPFRRETLAATLAAITRETPPPPSFQNPGLPPEVDALIMHLLEKEPAARCASPQELLDSLHALAAGTARRAPEIPAGRRWRPALAWTTAVVAALILGATIVRLRRPSVSAVPAGAWYLVVEPFRSLSPTPSDTVFALGLTEAVQTRLAEVPGIQVVAFASDPGTPFLLDGTVQRSRDKLRITCRVVERKGGAILVGAVAEGSAEDLFALQDKVTARVVKTLSLRLHLAATGPKDQRPTADVTAYDYYLQGRGYLQRPGETEDRLVAAELFQKALAADPGFALAEAGLAQTYWKLYEDGRDPSWATRAEESARKALDLAPRLAEVHIALGTIQQGTGKSSLAAGEFRRALEINPRSTEAFVGLAKAQETLGDIDAAERTFRDAIAARPGDWSPWSQLGAFYRSHGRFDEALQCFVQVVALTPDNARGYANLGVIQQELGRDAEAVASYERSLHIKPGYRAYANLATLYRSQRRYAEAARTYEQALALDDHDYRVWGNLGATCRLIEGRRAAADSAYRRAIVLAEGEWAVNRSDPMVLALLAQYHAEVREPIVAREMAGRAVEAGSSRPDVLVYISAAYEILGDRVAALETARRAMALGGSPETWSRDPNMDELVKDPRFRKIVDAAELRRGEGAK